MFELSVKGDFASSHILNGHDGKCKNLHGHTWKVEATVVGNRLNEIGLLVDFKLFKKQLKDFLEGLDHVHLNDLPAFKDMNPTTENLARYIYEEFGKVCRPLVLSKVTVWESDSASVTYFSSG